MAENATDALYGGIEGGGTNFVCAVGRGPDDVCAQERFATTTPDETFGRVIAFFRGQPQVAAIGIGSFGPIGLNPASPEYGYITTTPKPHWPHTDFVGTVQREFQTPVGFDTDVNAAALGEHRWGAAQGLDTFIYLTVGTGIGGGGLANGRLMHGLIHPEMGHIRVPHDLKADPYKGNCKYHGDCLEGLACGPALGKRWGVERAHELPPGHPAWDLEAQYLALGLVNFICAMSPQRIIMGGGVMDQAHLFPLVRKKVLDLLNKYVAATEIREQIDTYIVPPALGKMAGVLGAIALAQVAAEGAA